MMQLSLGTKPLTLLCLGAHCDDIEIGCGGTLLKLLKTYEITRLKWVVFASNEQRAQEAHACARAFLGDLKEAEIIVQSFRDAYLPFQAVEVKDFFNEIRQGFEPDLVFTHYREDRHQDHRLVSDLTWNTFRNHVILEYEIPKYDGDLGKPNVFVPLEAKDLDRKIALLHEHYPSQSGKHWFDEETFKALPRLRGMECASRYAEAFYARKMVI